MTRTIPPRGQASIPEVSTNSEKGNEASDFLDLPKAAERLGISTKTLRKRCVRGEVEGATKADYAKGARWVIPIATLERLENEGSQRVATAPQTLGSEVLKLRDELQTVSQKLHDTEVMLEAQTVRAEAQKVRAEAGEQIALERLARIADLQQSQFALSGAVRALTEAAEVTKPKWWQKIKPRTEKVPPTI